MHRLLNLNPVARPGARGVRLILGAQMKSMICVLSLLAFQLISCQASHQSQYTNIDRIALPSLANPPSIYGTIVDEKNYPIVGAIIELRSTAHKPKTGMATDYDGQFRFSGLSRDFKSLLSGYKSNGSRGLRKPPSTDKQC